MPTLTTTGARKLKINKLTKTQIENASSLSNTELYLVDPEYTGGKVTQTNADGDIVESSVTSTELGYLSGVTSSVQNQINGKVADVQINGTSIKSNDVANIPLMTTTSAGVAMYGDGLQIQSGVLKILKATDDRIIAKGNGYNPIVPNTLNKAASVVARSIYDKFVAITSGAINIDEGSIFYTDSPTEATTYTISTSATTQSGYTYRYFNVLINMPSTPVGIDFTTNNTITWTENTTPDMSTGGRTYLLAFQTFDGGTTWIGSLATWWVTPASS